MSNNVNVNEINKTLFCKKMMLKKLILFYVSIKNVKRKT